MRVTTRPVARCEDYDADVEANHQYEYKVRAHNAVGPGPHSDPSLHITARPMKAAPKLDMDVLNRRVRVRAGERIKVKDFISVSFCFFSLSLFSFSFLTVSPNGKS